MAQDVRNPASIHEDSGLIPGLTQWVKGSGIAMSCDIACRCFGSGVAMAVLQADSYSSKSNPSLGTSICRRHGTKKTKEKKVTF